MYMNVLLLLVSEVRLKYKGVPIKYNIEVTIRYSVLLLGSIIEYHYDSGNLLSVSGRKSLVDLP